MSLKFRGLFALKGMQSLRVPAILYNSRKYKQGEDGLRRGIKNFQQFIRNIIRLINVCKCFLAGLKGVSGFQNMIEKEYCGKIAEDSKSSSVFDWHEFSVSKEQFPIRAIQITRKPPSWRTELEIKHLRIRMQLLESFRQYSPTLQYLLAKVVRYERFGRRRVIIKKGQDGVCFYFIYSGSVAITDDEDGSSAFVETTPTSIQKGASFGEIALLQRTKRVATVVCLEDTELLVVDKKDFFGHKLDKELERDFRYRYSILRNLDLFKTMPDSSIDKIANFCKIERFHFGQVITTDFAEAGSMLFVIKGICEVLRLVDLTTCSSYHRWIAKQLCYPKPKIQPQEKRRASSDVACVDRFKSTIWSSYTGRKVNDLKWYYLQKGMSAWENCEKQNSLLSPSSKNIVIQEDKGKSERFPYEPPQLDDPEMVQNIVSGVFQKKSSFCNLYGEIPASVAAAVYVRIDELHKGDSIVNLDDSRVLVLISQGVEIIRLKKEKIDSWADEDTAAKLNKLKVRYPSDDELCQVFLRQNSWEMFKKDLVKLVMQPKLTKMVYPPHPCPASEIYNAWYMNKEGILDISALRYKKTCPPLKHKYFPAQLSRFKEGLPTIQPKLVHGISVMRPNLDGAF